jgi:hypothetical protein
MRRQALNATVSSSPAVEPDHVLEEQCHSIDVGRRRADVDSPGLRAPTLLPRFAPLD